MQRIKQGKCDTCKLIYEWPGKPLLREAYCLRCKGNLKLTTHFQRRYERVTVYPGQITK